MTQSTTTRAVSLCAAILFGMAAIPVNTARGEASAAKDAYIRGAHFSPDTASVDVYLTAFSGGTSTLWLSDVGYGDVSPYRHIAAGTYAVSMRPHGAPASQKPALTWTLNLKAGAAYTAAAIGMSAQIRGVVLSDKLTTPPAGSGLVRVIQASSRAGHVSIRAEPGPVLTHDIAFGSISGYKRVPSGRWTLEAQSSTRPSLSATQAVSVESASVESVVLLDTRGAGLTVHTLVDAAGTSHVPTGPVPAGGGGTAPRARAGLDGLISWAALGCAAVVVLLARVRSQTRRPSPRR
jgi:hypothetical protein